MSNRARASATGSGCFEVTIAFLYFMLVIAIMSILRPVITSFYISVVLVGRISFPRLANR